MISENRMPFDFDLSKSTRTSSTDSSPSRRKGVDTLKDKSPSKRSTVSRITPGTWQIESCDLVTIGNEKGELVADLNGCRDEKTQIGNARLIVAAPILLGVLQRVLQLVHDDEVELPGDCEEQALSAVRRAVKNWRPV